MIYYHGSIVPNLKTLLPFNMPHSNMDEECVYFAANKTLALFYIWPRKYMWLTYGFCDENIPVYTETHPEALAEFYKDVTGYIYSCDVDEKDILENETGIKIAVVARGAQKIVDAEKIDDVYRELLEREKEGEIIIRRFKDLTDKEHNKNEKMILSGIKRLNLLDGGHPLSSFVKFQFPDIWERAKHENQ